MKLYLDPGASLKLIRHLRSVNGTDGIEGSLVRRRTLNDAINTVRGVKELDATAQFWLGHVGLPIHVFVPDQTKNTSTNHLVTHVFNQSVPYGCFLDLGHDVCICTPQFAYLRLGAELGFFELLSIGLELCGTYSRFALDDIAPAPWGGCASPKAQGCTFEIPPAMNAKRFEAFLERMQGQRGAVGARKTVRWLADGSASPMETAIYLLLCLPKHLGGYGLPKPLLNPLLVISTADGVKKRNPDLFWPGANIDVEYNSDEEHSGEWARYHDSKREIELTAANVRVLPLTRPQLMDAREFDGFAQGLRRMLGVRTRPTEAGWAGRRDELRRSLLG